MKPISIQVDDKDYRELASLAGRTGRSVDDLLQEAMTEYLGRRRGRRGSILEIAPHESGPQIGSWSRDEIFDEMIDS